MVMWGVKIALRFRLRILALVYLASQSRLSETSESLPLLSLISLISSQLYILHGETKTEILRKLLTPGYDRKQVVQITGNVFLILSLILHTATSSVWYRSAPLPSLYLPLPLPILLSARLELPPAVTSFYTTNRLPVQRRSNPS